MYLSDNLLRSFNLKGAVIATIRWNRTLGLLSRDLTEQLEETTFPLTTDTTIHGTL